MAIVIPDLVLVNTVNQCLTILRDDYNNNRAQGTLGRSILYLLFGSKQLGKYILFENAVKLIVTTPESPKHIECKLSFDHNSQSVAPVIWVTLPSENNKNNSLGLGEGIVDELLLSNDPDQDKIQDFLCYRWATTYQIVIAAQNKNETIVLYHLLKCMIIAVINHLSTEGLENIKVGGQDIKLTLDTDRIFQKAITLNFEYEQAIPKIASSFIYRTIRLYWRPVEAVTAQGPIEFSVEDDLSPSDSQS